MLVCTMCPGCHGQGTQVSHPASSRRPISEGLDLTPTGLHGVRLKDSGGHQGPTLGPGLVWAAEGRGGAGGRGMWGVPGGM